MSTISAAMRAALCIQTGVGDTQPFNGPAAYEMLADDFGCIFRFDVAVPDSFWVNDDCGSMLALVKTARLVDAHAGAEACGLGQLLQLRVELALAVGGAGGTGRALGTHIGADKDMMFKCGQTNNLREIGLTSE